MQSVSSAYLVELWYGCLYGWGGVEVLRVSYWVFHVACIRKKGKRVLMVELKWVFIFGD